MGFYFCDNISCPPRSQISQFHMLSLKLKITIPQTIPTTTTTTVSISFLWWSLLEALQEKDLFPVPLNVLEAFTASCHSVSVDFRACFLFSLSLSPSFLSFPFPFCHVVCGSLWHGIPTH